MSLIKRACLVFAVCIAASACTHRPSPLLGGRPWPTDTEGHYVEGTAQVVVLVSSEGRALGACLERSAGNATLDFNALHRFDATQFRPEIKEGVRVTSWARIPVAYTLPGHTPATPLQSYPVSRKGFDVCTAQLVERTEAAG